jgi:hypoxia up-regulated 1
LPDNLFETTLTGLTKAFVNHTEETIANSTIKVTIELDQSNVVSVTKAVVVLGHFEAGEDDVDSPTLNGAHYRSLLALNFNN